MTTKLFAGPSFYVFPGSSKTVPIAITNPEDTEVNYTIEVDYVTNTNRKKWLILDRDSGTLKPKEVQTLYVTASATDMKSDNNYQANLTFFTKDGHKKLDDLSIELYVSCFPYGDNGPHSAVVGKIQDALAPASPNALAPASSTKNTFSLQVSNPHENGRVKWTMSTGGVNWVSLNQSEGILQGGGQTTVDVTTDKSNLQTGTYRTNLRLTITFEPNPENREPSSILFPVKLTVPSKIVSTLKGIAAPKENLKYHGGHLLTAVEIYTIFWGSDWEKGYSNVIKDVNKFFDYILHSPLIDLLKEYSVGNRVIGSGKRIGSKTITSSEPGQMVAGGSREIDDTKIQQALQGWIANGTIPQPNENTLFFVYLPPDVTAVLNGDRSCKDFCGYHEVINKTIFYAVVPFINCEDCKFGQIIDSLTKTSSHELCEAITDPALDGWHEESCDTYEIGDICNHVVQQLNGYTIQAEWSNKANACLIHP
jgi:Viral BACON domain